MLPYGIEWIIILIVAVLIFGKRLPELARNLGKGMVEFKRGMKEVKDVKDDIRKEVTGPLPSEESSPREARPRL